MHLTRSTARLPGKNRDILFSTLSQKEFYQENAKPLLQYLLYGVNCLVVTYGAQGYIKNSID